VVADKAAGSRRESKDGEPMKDHDPSSYEMHEGMVYKYVCGIRCPDPRCPTPFERTLLRALGVATKKVGLFHGCLSAERDLNKQAHAMIKEISRVLDDHLGDTDPQLQEEDTDEEIKREYPEWWACRELYKLMDIRAWL